MTYYDLLGIPRYATFDQIKSAYRQQIKFFHPDVFDGSPDVADIKTRQLNEAYEVLSNPQRRFEYDRELYLKDKQFIDALKNKCDYYQAQADHNVSQQEATPNPGEPSSKSAPRKKRSKNRPNHNLRAAKGNFALVVVLCALFYAIFIVSFSDDSDDGNTPKTVASTPSQNSVPVSNSGNKQSSESSQMLQSLAEESRSRVDAKYGQAYGGSGRTSESAATSVDGKVTITQKSTGKTWTSSGSSNDARSSGGLMGHAGNPIAPIKAQPRPDNAKTFVRDFPDDDAASLIIINSPKGCDCLVKMKDEWDATILSFYVRKNSSIEKYCPAGNYTVYFAFGTTWYGYDNLFGEDMICQKDKGVQFEENYSWEYTLYAVPDGNFSLEAATPEEILSD